MKKTINNLFSIALMVFSVSAFSACDFSKTSSTSQIVPNIEDSISFSETSKNLIIGDEFFIISYTSDTGKNLTFYSTNPTVAKVDDEGNVEAICAGEATIVGTYGDATAVCVINVSSDTYVPSLHFVNNVDSSISVPSNSDLNLSMYVLFNGKKFYDAVVSYDVVDSTVGTINGSTFKASNKIGYSTKINIHATWRGFDIPSFNKVVEVKIVTVKNVYLNGGELGNINLFTIDRINDVNYKTSQVISKIEAVQDEEKLAITDVEVIQSSTEPIVSFDYNSVNKTCTISSLKNGTAILRVHFNDKDGNPCQQDFDIVVTMPIYEIPEVVPYFSINDGKFVDNNVVKSLATLFPSGDKTIVSAKQDDRELAVKNNAVFDVETTTNDNVEEVSLSLYNDVMGIKLKVNAYQKVVTSVDDFKKMFATSNIVKGYYILNNDITSSEIITYTNAKNTKFEGVFDGNGHKLSLKLGHDSHADEWGLFGNELTGTIKNTAFVNCTADSAVGGFIAHHAQEGAIIQDCYINVTINNGSGNQFGVMYSTYGFLTLNRVILHVPTLFTATSGRGAFAVHKVTPKTSNFIIVSANEIGVDSRFKSYLSQAESNLDSSFTGNKFILTGTQKYNTFTQFDNSGNKDVSAFPSNYWDTSSGVPVFKGCTYYSK